LPHRIQMLHHLCHRAILRQPASVLSNPVAA
jgi:hypothetical protein